MEDKTFYINLLEHDLNPFILFNSDGKMQDFNREAEFLFNFVSPKELYELALAHASIDFGFNRQFISLQYGKLRFYAILVGYIDDEYIGLRLYKEVSTKETIYMSSNIELTNLFSLIDLSKTTTLLQSDVKIKEIYDVSIPQIKLNINEFLLILNECFSLYKDSKYLELKVYIKIGEYEIIQNKKYPIISIEFQSEHKTTITDNLETKILQTHFHLFINQNRLILELPMIL